MFVETDREPSMQSGHRTSDAVVVVGSDGTIIAASGTAASLFGYPEDELVGQPVELLVPDSHRALHEDRRLSGAPASHGRALGTGRWFEARRKDGTTFAADIALTQMRRGADVVTTAVVRDVSGARATPDTEAWLNSITDASQDALIGTTVDGAITLWNPGAQWLYGYAAAEVVGCPIDLLCTAGEHERARETRQAVGRGELVLPYEIEHVRKDGTLTPVLITHRSVTGASGDVMGIVTVHRDESERVRAETMFRGLLEAAPDAMVCVGTDGYIAVVNEETERLFGYPRCQLVGAPIEMLVPDAHRTAHAGHRAAYFEAPRPRIMGEGRQVTARRADGTEFPVDINLSGPLQTADGTLISAAIRDVSERIATDAERERLKAEAAQQRFESQMHRSRRLESLGQLAGGVAHDFNNLLGIILNYTAFAAEEVAAASAERTDERWTAVADDLDQARLAAERGAHLTRQLLAVGQREVFRPEIVDLSDVVRGVEALLRRAVGEDVDVVASFAPDLRPVMADPGKIEQVLVNLAVNARDAMPGGGTLCIDTSNVVIDADHTVERPGARLGPHVRMRVSDTGVGMERDVMERAFEPFFTTKPSGVGTGLGLATVYGIISQAGGDTQIYSEPGIGTSVSVLLPATDAEASVLFEEASDVGAARGETVLVVEDEEAMRALTVRILLGHGYRVIAAGSGSDALIAAADHAGVIDLLLTDVVMPQMLGKEVAQRIVALRPGVRVMFMSGYAQPVLSSRGTLDPEVTLLGKPFTKAVLLATVRDVLDA
ncbi:MAG: PAS domain S-box protein [Acidimicrobiales bacterium]